MKALKPIRIIGGGLAGLTLGISLRRRGIPVITHEASHYPRHRVCGEFISGRGQEVLCRLGLAEVFARAGARPARTAAFFVGGSSSPVRVLAKPALCLSRFKMDALLAERFKQGGGELIQSDRWKGDYLAEGVVRANGRRPQLNERGFRWFGLKAHAWNVPLAADIEIHGSDAGYVGICRLEGGAVNVCGLFRRADAGPPGAAPNAHDWLRGQPGSQLWQRLAQASWDEESFCSVAALGLAPRRACALAECSIGDALTMVPPVTGNGMSMAFEGAELAMEPLTAFSRGEISWPATQKCIAAACDRAFARRLVWAALLQRLMFARWMQRGGGVFLLGSDWFWRLMFSHTR